MKKALIIEDDDLIRSNLVELLTEEGFIAFGAENGRRGIELARRESPSLIICDLRMPEMDGFQVLTELRATDQLRATPFIFLTAAADRADIRTGMRLGADDYVTKPFTRIELLDAIRTRLERRDVIAGATGPAPPKATAPAEHAWTATPEATVVADPVMRQLHEDAAKVAPAMISVLLLGETGVGKEVLAQTIHRLSPRAGKPFLALNCAALSETLLESELFGNERGAFTGAVTARPGLFESAEGGTVFLDEVGDLPMVIQVKLLRVLEERRVLRVGGRAPIAIDVRFLSATNKDLDVEVTHGRFREDLIYRIAGITLLIPPLRDRPSEILALAARFARTARSAESTDPVDLSPEVRGALLRHAWPGNVRELKNVIERAVVLASGAEIGVQHLPAKFSGPAPDRASAPPDSERADGPARAANLRTEMEDLERKRIVEALEQCGGNQTAAADMLGMSRRTLVTRLSAYELPRPRKR